MVNATIAASKAYATSGTSMGRNTTTSLNATAQAANQTQQVVTRRVTPKPMYREIPVRRDAPKPVYKPLPQPQSKAPEPQRHYFGGGRSGGRGAGRGSEATAPAERAAEAQRTYSRETARMETEVKAGQSAVDNQTSMDVNARYQRLTRPTISQVTEASNIRNTSVRQYNAAYLQYAQQRGIAQQKEYQMRTGILPPPASAAPSNSVFGGGKSRGSGSSRMLQQGTPDQQRSAMAYNARQKKAEMTGQALKEQQTRMAKYSPQDVWGQQYTGALPAVGTMEAFYLSQKAKAYKSSTSQNYKGFKYVEKIEKQYGEGARQFSIGLVSHFKEKPVTAAIEVGTGLIGGAAFKLAGVAGTMAGYASATQFSIRALGSGLATWWGVNVAHGLKASKTKSRDLGDVAGTAAAFTAGGIGGDVLAARGIGYATTWGRTKISEKNMIPEDVRSGKKAFPEAPKSKEVHYQKFMTESQRLPGQTESMMFHQTGNKFWKSGEPFSVKKGTSEYPGLFGSYGVSPHFLRIGSRLGFYGEAAGEAGIPGAIAIKPTSFVKGMRTKLGQAGIPANKLEVQAIEPETSIIMPYKGKYYSTWQGVRYPVDIGIAQSGASAPAKVSVSISPSSSYSPGSQSYLISPSRLGLMGVSSFYRQPSESYRTSAYRIPTASSPSMPLKPSLSMFSISSSAMSGKSFSPVSTPSRPSSYKPSPYSPPSYAPYTPPSSSISPASPLGYYPYPTSYGRSPLDFGMGRTPSVTKKRKYRYAPSVTALSLGIRGSKPKMPKKGWSGYEFRPVLR